MPASDTPIILFPAGDAGTLAWHGRSLDNAGRAADARIARAAAAATDFADLAPAWTRLAADAALVLAALQGVESQLAALEECRKAILAC